MPRIVDHDARRSHVLEGAFTVFDERGYGAVSMRDLARSLGVSTGTLYHYFEGKDALFEELGRRRCEADLAAATGQIPDDASPDLRLAMIGRWVQGHVPHLAATLRLVLDYLRQGGDESLVRDILAGYRAPLADALGPELAEPGLSLVLGMLVHHLLDADRVDARAHLDLLVAVRGLRWSPEGPRP